MRAEAGRISPWAEWAWASEPLPGEPEEADRAIVVARPAGFLAAVVDGLGHGPDAVHAAKKAIATIEAHAAAPVDGVLAACHVALVGSRGAVMSILAVDSGTLSWIGIGDVEAVHHPARVGKRESLLLMPGVIGDRYARLRAHSHPIAQDDTIVLATDGVRRAFLDEPVRNNTPPELAEIILKKHARGTDDALVLVIRYDQAA